MTTMTKNDVTGEQVAAAVDALGRGLRGVVRTLQKMHASSLTTEAVDFVERRIAEAEHALSTKEPN